MVFSRLTLRQKSQAAIADIPALTIAAQRLIAQITSGEHAMHKKGGHEKFWQYREYEHGDRPQDIDWRQSAKSDHIYIREKELQTPQIFHLACSATQSMDFKSVKSLHSKREAAQIITLALAIMLSREGESIAPAQNHQNIRRAGSGKKSLNAIAQYLLDTPKTEDNTALGFIPAAPPKRNSALILCGDFLTPIDEITHALTPLHASLKGSVLIQILDPAERNLPYSGTMIFDDNTAPAQKIDNIADIRAAYQTRIEQHISDITDLCTSIGAHHILHVTDTPLETTAFNIWERLHRP